ncbi:hypothetical protein [Shewanella glacialipiscicola]|uniref:hypothetical protein n=1 Tax=Shewanella glacialipiscicola TaxID=614069 RepID=UPI003D7B8969
MAKKSHLFAHLLKHFRAYHAELLVRFRERHEDPTEQSLIRLTQVFGALDCLYWQALGCGEVLLAKKIARTIKEPFELTYGLIGIISTVTPCRDAS